MNFYNSYQDFNSKIIESMIDFNCESAAWNNLQKGTSDELEKSLNVIITKVRQLNDIIVELSEMAFNSFPWRNEESEEESFKRLTDMYDCTHAFHLFALKYSTTFNNYTLNSELKELGLNISNFKEVISDIQMFKIDKTNLNELEMLLG